MEKNLHNDNLDDFLRKSFDQYDDSPSDGLWDKIDADLAGKPQIRPIGSQQRWWAWAAAAVLLSLVIVQYIYFQKEKAGMAEIINMQNNKIEALEKQLKERENNISENSNLKINETPINLNKKQTILTPEIKEQKRTADLIENSTPNNIYSKEKKKSYKSTILSEDHDLTDKNISKIESNNIANNINPIEAIADQQNNTITLNLLDLIDLENVEPPVPDLSLPAMAFIDPVSNFGNFSIGIHHAYLSTREKMARVIQRPMGGSSPVFNNTKAMTGTTKMTGITAVYQTKNHWLFESGVNCRGTTMSTSHHAQLRFMDRQPNGTDHQYDFEYALNTSAGVVDIEVRADQTDPTQTINEFEKINIEIIAEQVIDYVSVPFLIGRQIGNGRMNATIKSGVLFNFLTRQSFGVSGSILNNNLRNSRAMFSRRNGIGLKNTTTDLIAAIGLNYELNRKWTTHVSPIIIVPMGTRHNDPYIKSSGISAGIDLGIRFNF